MNDASLTAVQKILAAGAVLEDAGVRPFTAADLVVRAWQLYPQTFGLAGYVDQFPCSNAVLAALMGAKGIVNRGYVSKVAPKTYQLTQAGREFVNRIGAEDCGRAIARPQLRAVRFPPPYVQTLRDLLTTVAFQRRETGMWREVTYRDAQVFWGLSALAVGAGVDKALETVPAFLDKVAAHMKSGEVELPGGQTVTQAQVDRLRQTCSWLAAHFSGRISQQREKRVYV